MTDPTATDAALLGACERRFMGAAAATSEILWTNDSLGQMRGEQSAWLDFTGQNSAQCQGDGWVDAVHPDDAAGTTAAWQQGVAAGVNFTFEHRVRRADGVYRTFAVRAVPVADESGQVAEWVGAHRDVSEQRQLEAELLESSQRLQLAQDMARASVESAARTKDDFLATVSHELRTPLNAMLGWTSLLQRPNLAPAALSEGLRIIERNGRAQARLIEDLFDANRLISGEFDLDLQSVSPDAAVRAAMQTSAPALARRQQILVDELGASGAVVQGDSSRLQQVVNHLLSNAGEYSPSGARVRVRTEADDGFWQLQIIDTGEGIPPGFLPHVFERFRQNESGVQRRHGGLGLGLAICRQIVSHLGGEIRAFSAGAGLGATFAVRLPLLDGAKSCPSGTDPDPPSQPLPDNSLRGLEVLAVDDEPDALEYLARMLRENGAAVTAVSSAQQALDSLGAGPLRFDVLVSDVGMPGTSGYQLIRQIRADPRFAASALPAIALTAFARAEDRDTALAQGFQAHIAKPFHPEALIRALSSLARHVGKQQLT